MPESKEKLNKIETKGLSNILAEAQNDFVKSDLDALKNRMNFAASLDNVNLKELPKENELKNFEGFQWEVVHLAAYLIRKLNFSIDSVKNIYKGSINKDLLPAKLQLVYAKVQELGKIGVVSPVYGKIFEKWEENVTQYIQPHAQNILKVYNEDSILDTLPPQLKNLNPVTGTILGGGLALAYWAIKKFTGEKNEPVGLGKILAMVFGGTLIGSIPAVKNVVSNYQYIKDESTKIFTNSEKDEKVNIEIEDTANTQIFPSGFSMSNVATIDDLFKNANQDVLQKMLGNIPISVLYGQMALESGGSISSLGRKYNNFFGIKYRDGMKDAVPVEMGTNEEVNGKMVRIKDKFAHFNSPNAGFKYYIQKMMNPAGMKDSHYGWIQKFAPELENLFAVKENNKWIFVSKEKIAGRNAVSLKNNPIAVVECIRGSGYATDSKYSDKVAGVLQGKKGLFNLSIQDIEAGKAFAKFYRDKVSATKTAYLNNKTPPSLA